MHLLRSIAPVALAGLLCNASMASGQNPAVPAPATQAAASQAAAPVADATVVHANANLVLVDVVVTDRGNAVHGLDRSRFHILENGHEQTIASFDEHMPGGTESKAAAAPSTPSAMQPALPPHTFSNVPKYPEAPAVNVLLLDGLNTPVANQLDMRHQMLEYLGKIEPGTSLAIFTLSSQLRQVVGFTTDVPELTKALKNAKAGAQVSSVIDPAFDQTIDSTVGELATMGSNSNAVAAMQQFQSDLTIFQTDQRVRMTLDAMQQLARYLNAIPGRKNLIWFSGSFPLALDPDASLTSPFESMRNYSDDIRETAELLSAARVAVYPVDARGLMTRATADASYAPSTNLMGGGPSSRGRGNVVQSNPMNKPSMAKDDAKFMKQTMLEQASMQQIAEQTGGQAYINTNGLKEAVASAVENGSSYYTIGYVPGAKQFDGQFRKIQLRVDNPDYKLTYRDGYYADSPDRSSTHLISAVSLITAATLHGAPPATQIVLQAHVMAATDPLLQGAKLDDGPAGEITAALKKPVHRYVVDLNVDPHGLAFDEMPDGLHVAKMEFVLVAYDAEGNRVNYLDRGFALKVKPAQFANTMVNGIRTRLALDLPAGLVYLRIAARDLAAGRVGSLEIPLAVAAQ